MNKFICPKCKDQLTLCNKTLKCDNNHCFDLAKQGYVNLLMSQQSSQKRHGDDKLMVKSRTNFLEKGYYLPLLNKINETLTKYINSKSFVLDVGCGECFYTEKIAKNFNCEIYGIDISKDALMVGAKKNDNLHLAVASIFNIPIKDSSCDCIINIFAPHSEDEFKRILKDSGILLRVTPLENHLWELKENIYDTPYKNEVEDFLLSGFELLENVEVKYTIDLTSNDDIVNLFKMTPYYYKTSKLDQEKVEDLTSLSTQIEFSVLIYKKS